MDNSAIAIAAVVMVVVAIGGIYLVQKQTAQRRTLSNEQRIGQGLGQLVGGIIGLATASDGGGEA